MNACPYLSSIIQKKTLRHGVKFLVTLHIPKNFVSLISDESKLREYIKYN